MRLIVGTNSDIGRAVKTYWDTNNTVYHASTRNKDSSSGARPHIDLRKDITLDEQSDYDVAVLCAGITRLELCRKDPAGTRKINVDGTLRLARYLSERGTYVIFLSTDKVYDGSRKYRSPDDNISPITEYGRQKAEAEQSILQLTNGVVLRVAKVVYPSQELFAGWVKDLKSGERISPFSDMYFSPVSMTLVCKIIDQLISRRADGIWHASSAGDITYEVAARHIATCLGVEKHLVEGSSFRESERICGEEVPRHTSLDMEKTSTLGIVPEDPIKTIHKTICLADA